MQKLVWTNIRVKLGDLKPWSDNPRFSTKAQAERLIKQLDELGQFQTLSVGPNLEVYDGHQRLSAWMTIHGAGYEIDARQSNRPLTEDERRRMVFAANVQAGNWDADKLAAWDAPQVLEWAGVDASAWQNQKREVAMWGEMLAAELPEFDPMKEWEGMPEFNNEDLRPQYSIIVNFENTEVLEEFAKLINQRLTKNTKSIWFPVRPEKLTDQLGTKARLSYTNES